MDCPPQYLALAQELRHPADEINLAAAALYIAQGTEPDLNVAAYLHKLDAMAAAVHARLPTERYPLRVIQTINQYLFEGLGFKGNGDNYYDPRNSYLNQVLDRRLGIPITLALVYLEIANRIDFPMVGVGLPGHFLIRPVVNEMAVFVDAFNGGEILFEADCETRLQQIYGPPARLAPEYLAAVSPQQFLARMLNNLKQIYLTHQDMAAALGVIEQLLIVMPENQRERRDRGLIYFHQGRFGPAAKDLQAYLQAFPDAPDGEQVTQILSWTFNKKLSEAMKKDSLC